jgi:hypothetical protein
MITAVHIKYYDYQKKIWCKEQICGPTESRVIHVPPLPPDALYFYYLVSTDQKATEYTFVYPENSKGI